MWSGEVNIYHIFMRATCPNHHIVEVFILTILICFSLRSPDKIPHIKIAKVLFLRYLFLGFQIDRNVTDSELSICKPRLILFCCLYKKNGCKDVVHAFSDSAWRHYLGNEIDCCALVTQARSCSHCLNIWASTGRTIAFLKIPVL
jgi:hypothetical protein